MLPPLHHTKEVKYSLHFMSWAWIPWNLSFRYISLHEKRLQMMLWHHNARVNSHQRWKQTRFRICFHLWCELTSTMNVTEWQVSWNSSPILNLSQLSSPTTNRSAPCSSWSYPQCLSLVTLPPCLLLSVDFLHMLSHHFPCTPLPSNSLVFSNSYAANVINVYSIPHWIGHLSQVKFWCLFVS